MSRIRVTDHAVLRYLERVHGFDVEAVRAHIAKTCEGPAAVGASIVRSEGVRFAISQNGSVTTVMPDSTRPTKTHQDRLKRGPVKRAAVPA